MKRWGWVLVLVFVAVAAAPVAAEEEVVLPPKRTVAELKADIEAKLAAGDMDGALKDLDEAMRVPEVPGDMALQLGVLREGRGELDLAIDAYGKGAGVLEGAQKGEALGRMAVLQNTRGMSEATATAEAAQAADPGGVWPAIALSYARAKGGNSEEAVTLARSAVDGGGGPSAQAALGNALAVGGDTDGAESAYRAAMAADESQIGPAIGLATLLRTSGRAAEAEPLLNEVIERSPGAVSAYMEMARVKIALGRAPEALGDAAMAAAMADNDPEAQALVIEVRIARSLEDMRQGNQALAETELGQLRDEKPDFAPVRLALAQAQLERRDADAAIAELTKAVELDPEYTEAQYELGRTQLRLKKDAASAVGPLEKAVSLDEGNAQYMTELGAALVQAQQFDKAVEVLTEATALPDYANAEGYFSLGQAYVNLKSYGDAVEPLTKASTLSPDAAPIWATLGWAYFGLKDADNFKSAAGKAKTLGYNEPTLLKYLERIEKGEEIK